MILASFIYYQGTKEQDIRSNGFGIDIIPTIGINVSNGFAINISFGGLSYETIKEEDASDGTKTFDIDFGRDIRIGISKNFGGTKEISKK